MPKQAFYIECESLEGAYEVAHNANEISAFFKSLGYSQGNVFVMVEGKRWTDFPIGNLYVY